MIVTDDHSKFKAVHILKSDVVVALEALINILEIKVGRHVQKVRSDRGKEFKNVGVHQLFAALSIEQHLRVGYAPQYNGAAKCAIGVVCTMSRALHKEAGLPAQWGGGAQCNMLRRS
jgi:hypothetical protein